MLLCSDQRHGEGMNTLITAGGGGRNMVLMHPYGCFSVSAQHGAYAKAFSVYTDLLNNRLTGELQETTGGEMSSLVV